MPKIHDKDLKNIMKIRNNVSKKRKYCANKVENFDQVVCCQLVDIPAYSLVNKDRFTKNIV